MFKKLLIIVSATKSMELYTILYRIFILTWNIMIATCKASSKLFLTFLSAVIKIYAFIKLYSMIKLYDETKSIKFNYFY